MLTSDGRKGTFKDVEKRDNEISCKMKKSAGYKRTASQNERGILKAWERKEEMENQTEKQEATSVMRRGKVNDRK